MPCDYSKYPPNWHSEIRPAILKRADNKCENCGIPHEIMVIRGTWNGVDCYQDEDGTIYDAATSRRIGEDYVGEVHPTNQFVKIVLTIAHLDHDTTNNDYANLRALCQRCHNRHDAGFRKSNRRATQNKNRGLNPLFP